MKNQSLLLFALMSPLLMPSGREAVADEPAALVHREHVVQDVQGWKIHVDKKLLLDEHREVRQLGLQVLDHKLHDIVLMLPADRVQHLREVPIYLDLDHALGNLQYHPGAGWLKDNGHDVAMTKAVHIPKVQRLINLAKSNTQPAVMLHELAHAYHDRVLGFDEETIRQAFDHVAASGRLESVGFIHGGKKRRHYALTNHKEFFAEMTECYFQTNDFYPFVRGELLESEPEVAKLLKRIWVDPVAPAEDKELPKK